MQPNPSSARAERSLGALSALAILTMGAAITLPGAAMPQIRADLGWTMAQGGWLVGTYSVGFLIGLLAGGTAADRGRYRPALVGASVLFAGAWTAIGRVPWAPGNYALQFVAGLGGGAYQAVVGALVIRVFRERAGAVLNLVHACVSVGTIGAPLLLWGILRAGGDWRDAFALAALGPVAVLLWSARAPFPARAPDEPDDPPAGGRPAGTYGFVRERPFQLLALAMACYVAAEFAVNVWLATYLTEIAGFSDAVGKWSLSAFWLALAVGRLGTAAAANRTDPGTLLVALSAAGLGAYGAALATEGTALSLALFFAFGLACSGIFPTLTVAAGLRYRRRAGAAVAAVTAAGTFGSAVVPPAMGALAESVGLSRAMWGYGVFLVAMIAATETFRRGK